MRVQTLHCKLLVNERQLLELFLDHCKLLSIFTILSLRGKMRVRKNPYSNIFYAVLYKQNI